MTAATKRRLFLLSAFLLFVLAYFVMAPDAPNLPAPPEQAEAMGRTAY
jgi:hypothetical protein